jgi:hypothetical protein
LKFGRPQGKKNENTDIFCNSKDSRDSSDVAMHFSPEVELKIDTSDAKIVTDLKMSQYETLGLNISVLTGLGIANE